MIYIYKGIGTSEESIRHTVDALKKENFASKTIDDTELLEGVWTKDAKLFIMPGGADVPYVKKLNGKGNQIIRTFVENGGSYLGLCAGAYYGSGYVEFDLGGKLEVVGKRELSFFPGKSIGPLLAPYDYNSKSGSRAAKIKWNGLDHPFSVYFSGGSYFEQPDQHSNIEVLATYMLDNKTLPAIIQIKFKKGKVVLSGVHFEYNPELLDAHDAHLKEIIPVLRKTDKERQNLVQSVLSYLMN